MPLSAFSIPAHYAKFLSHMLLPHGFIMDRIDKLADDLLEDFPAGCPHFLVVLKGGAQFANDLAERLRNKHKHMGKTTLPFTLDFIRVKSYEGTESTGKVNIIGIDLKTLAGRDVVIVEDIVDTGHTMAALLPYLMSQSTPPASVKVCTLLEKRTPRSNGFKAHYVGFSVPDSFVVG